MEYVGRTVAKTFPGYGKRKFKGTVTAFDKKDPKLPFHIKYEDGDSEDISKEELLQILVKEEGEQAAPKPGRGRPKKAAEPAEEPKKAKPAEEPKKKRGREAAKEEGVADEEQQQQQPANGEEVQGKQGKKSAGKPKGKKLRRSSPQRGGSSAGAGTAGAAAAAEAAAAAGVAAERGGTAGASGAAAAAGGRAAPRGSASAGGETGNKSAEAEEVQAQAAGPSERRGGGGGGGKKSKPSTSPSDLTNEAIEASQGLQDLITDVAAKSKARALNVVRFTGPPPAAAEPAGGGSGEGSGEPLSLKPLQSVAVTCGSLCFVSTIFPSDINALENEAPLDVVNAEYRRQAEQVLSQLETELKNIGSTKQHLINVTVMLREIDRGMTPFATVWNEWVHPTALPAMNVYESFMDKEALVAVAAQAAVPPQLFD